MKYTHGQAVTVQHKRTGRFIPGIVAEALFSVDPDGRVKPRIVGGQQQYAVDIGGGCKMQCGEDQVSAL